MTKFIVSALAILVSFGGAVRADEMSDRVAKAEKAIERAQAKLVKTQECAANPAPCLQAELDRARKSAERAAKKIEKTEALVTAYAAK